MKHLSILILGLLIFNLLEAQSFSEKMATKTCECLDSVNTYRQLEDSLKNCTSKAMVIVMREAEADEKDVMNTVSGITGTFKEVNAILPSICYNVRRLILEEKTTKFYKKSIQSSANDLYDKGNVFMENGDYVNSIKEFQGAIKIDKNFVYAIDHLAISYRRQENYKKAIKYYQQSLDIFPEGDVALLNIALSYSFLEDYDNSLKYYNNLIYFYPNYAEGYFGAAKTLFLKSDYDNAIDNLFIAHRLYIETNSDYKKDSEQLMGIMYNKLKEINRLDIFKAQAEKHNININVE